MHDKPLKSMNDCFNKSTASSLLIEFDIGYLFNLKIK